MAYVNKYSLADRLAMHTAPVDPDTGCMNWLGRPNDGGYGRVTHHGKIMRAHRAAYEIAKGPIVDGLVLDHLCRNRICVNPEHLEPVSIGDNVLRGETFAAENKAKTHCPQKHEYTPENTYLSNENMRHCRACGRDRARRKRGR